jgi:hypothetical protein
VRENILWYYPFRGVDSSGLIASGAPDSVKSTKHLPISMSRASGKIDRDPEKPPRGAGGAGAPNGFTVIERLVARVANIDLGSAESSDRSRRNSPVPRDPEKPAPNESGVWNKRGSRTVDRIVNWIVTGDPDMP